MIPERSLAIELADVRLHGDLAEPAHAAGIVVFVHGSGSSRRSARNRAVAAALQDRGLATLLFDLLSVEEDRTYANRFDIPRLTRRLLAVTQWLRALGGMGGRPLGYFGASTGAAAALAAASERGQDIAAVVSRGGRPDLAFDFLKSVAAPTLLLVGELDYDVLELNRRAAAFLPHCELVVIPGASHLFEEPGALERVAALAADWFTGHLAG